MPKKQAILQPFTPLWLALDVKHDWYYVRSLECEAPALDLAGQALFAALYMNEILYSMLKPLDESLPLFNVYVNTLQELACVSDRRLIEPILRRFERTLLEVVGYALLLTHDAVSHQPVDPTQYYQWVPNVGLVLSQNGFQGAHLLHFSENQFEDVETLRTAKILMRRVIAFAMEGKTIQTRSLYLTHTAE